MSTARRNTLTSAAVLSAGLALVGCGTAPAPGAGPEQPADQIDAVMHFPPGGLHDAMGELDRRLTGDAVLKTANGLFVQRDLRSSTRSAPSSHSATARARSRSTSPRRPPKRRSTVWVRDRTDRQIKELFDELPPTTKLVLANALSLDARWAVPFAAMPVTPFQFTTADGSVVQQTGCTWWLD